MIVSGARGRARGVVLWLGLAIVPALIQAQMPSEKGTVSQTIDGTTITIEYSRPVARGRTPFPDVVHWGRTWTPGANWATTIDVDRPVLVNGDSLPKGKYSIWMIPAQGPWTVMFSRDEHRFHTQPPSSRDEQLRLLVTPVAGAHMETLAFEFPVITRDGATLDMHWGTTVVPMRITVAPSRMRSVSDDERARYVGRYRLTPTGSHDAHDAIPETTLEVSDSAGVLHARLTPALWGYDPVADLVPERNDGEFRLAFFRAGKSFGMETEGLLIFPESGSRAASLELRSNGAVLARGVREN
jgi:hypothetical protein